MKTRNVISLLFVLLFAVSGFAQPKQKPSERIDAMKVAYLTKKLELTSDEAEKFWPVYNDYQDKRDALREELLKAKRKVKNGDPNTLTDADYEAYLQAEITYQQKDAELLKDFIGRVRKVLSKRKVALLLIAEDDFKKELLKRMSADKKPEPKKGQD